MRKVFVFLIVGLFCSAVLAEDDELLCYQSKQILKDTLSIIVSPDYWYVFPDLKSYFQELLQAYLIEDGNIVIERKKLEEVMSELKFDQSGAIKDGVSKSQLVDNSSKAELKRIGELTGADVMLFFSNWFTEGEKKTVENQCVGYRLVDCQTAQVLLSGHINQKELLHTARLIAYSIRVSHEKAKTIVGHHYISPPFSQDKFCFIKKIGSNYYAFSCQ